MHHHLHFKFTLYTLSNPQQRIYKFTFFQINSNEPWCDWKYCANLNWINTDRFFIFFDLNFKKTLERVCRIWLKNLLHSNPLYLTYLLRIYIFLQFMLTHLNVLFSKTIRIKRKIKIVLEDHEPFYIVACIFIQSSLAKTNC